jgi:hypothetical protein
MDMFMVEVTRYHVSRGMKSSYLIETSCKRPGQERLEPYPIDYSLEYRVHRVYTDPSINLASLSYSP